MSAAPCPREREIVRALVSGAADPEVEAHARGCSACREVAIVTARLRESALRAGDPAAAPPLPSPAEILWRAEVGRRLEERRRLLERAHRPVAWAGRAAAVVVAAGLAALGLHGEVVTTAAALGGTPTVAGVAATGAAALLAAVVVAGWAVRRMRWL